MLSRLHTFSTPELKIIIPTPNPSHRYCPTCSTYQVAFSLQQGLNTRWGKQRRNSATPVDGQSNSVYTLLPIEDIAWTGGNGPTLYNGRGKRENM